MHLTGENYQRLLIKLPENLIQGIKDMMEGSSRGPEDQAYIANLDYTLKELQSKVQQHEKELERVSYERDSQFENPSLSLV